MQCSWHRMTDHTHRKRRHSPLEQEVIHFFWIIGPFTGAFLRTRMRVPAARIGGCGSWLAQPRSPIVSWPAKTRAETILQLCCYSKIAAELQCKYFLAQQSFVLKVFLSPAHNRLDQPIRNNQYSCGLFPAGGLMCRHPDPGQFGLARGEQGIGFFRVEK